MAFCDKFECECRFSDSFFIFCMSQVNAPRIKDIALKAGVSIGTVDRVLHNRGEVARETRERILRIAGEMHYSPNLMARALKSKKKLQLVALLPDASGENEFWARHRNGLDEAMKSFEPFNLSLEVISFDLHRDDDFLLKSEQVLALHPDGILLAPVLKYQSQQFCDKLAGQGIPYVFFDSFIDETAFLSYTGEDAYQSGRVGAQLIDYGTPVDKDIVVVNLARDLANTLHLNDRTQGFLSYFVDSGMNRGRQLCLEIKNSEYSRVVEVLDEMMTSNGNIGAIFVTSSKAHKVARFLEQHGRTDVVLVGYDLLDRNVSYLRQGVIRFLISQRPAEQTERCVRKLFDYLLSDKQPVRMEYLPVDVVTSENVRYFF